MHEKFLSGEIGSQTLADCVADVTGVRNGARVSQLLSDPVASAKPLTLQSLIYAALKDLQTCSDLDLKTCMRTSAPPLRKNAFLTAEEVLREKSASPPPQGVCARFQSIIANRVPFPCVPKEEDKEFLREVARLFSKGSISAKDFRALLGCWRVTLPPSVRNAFLLPLHTCVLPQLSSAVKEQEMMGRCSLRQLWLGLVTALVRSF